MNDKYITVGQLTRYIKFKIDKDEHLNQVFLRGEISNFKAHTRGHLYFTIKDEESRINAVMFANCAIKLPFTPVDGMKVLIVGKVSVYEATGGYQIYVNEMIEDGVGNLYIKYEKLKKKLEEEGLFSQEHKKSLPKFPNKIGIITAPTGAAIRDILSTIERRWPLTETILFPSLVQGESAAPEIVKQLKKADTYNLDLIIVGRGGGSIEDMWCFNDEEVARTIFNMNTPIISAVGHEIDFTIADFVADLRAPTPTGAAEMAVPNRNDIIKLLNQINIRINQNINNVLLYNREKLNTLINSYVLKNPMNIYRQKEEKFDNIYERLQLSISSIVLQNKEKLNYLKNSYILTNPDKIYIEKKTKYNTIIDNLKNNINKIVDNKKNIYLNKINKLEALNPLLTIKRGYNVTRKNNIIISNINDLNKDDNINIEFGNGNLDAKVLNINLINKGE